MTTTIRDINELQDRRIMMEKKLPPFGYALILLTAALILFLVVWSTKNYRTYVSQSSGSVQAANKTYIMSSYSGSITELNIAEGTYVNEGDLIAHIKSTDLDMQQDGIQSQLDIYKKQKSQYCCWAGQSAAFDFGPELLWRSFLKKMENHEGGLPL